MPNQILFRDKSGGWGGGIIATCFSLFFLCAVPLRNEISQIGSPAPTIPIPPPAITLEPLQHVVAPQHSATAHQLHITADRYGQFWLLMRTNGRVDRLCLADTGATHVIISKKMARQLGLRNLNYRNHSDTANGETLDATAVLQALEIQGVAAQNFAVEVNGGNSDTCAVGMTWLKHFDISIASNVMTLTPKGDL